MLDIAYTDPIKFSYWAPLGSGGFVVAVPVPARRRRAAAVVAARRRGLVRGYGELCAGVLTPRRFAVLSVAGWSTLYAVIA